MNAGTKPHGQDDAVTYLAIAEELLAVCLESAKQERWRAAGLTALHAAVAAADAVCIRRLGERPSGPTHAESAKLLAATGAPGAREKAAQYGSLLRLKGRVEYEARPTTRAENELLVKQAAASFRGRRQKSATAATGGTDGAR